MNIRLGRMPWAMGWLFCASWLAAGQPSGDEVALLVRELSAEDFSRREAAAARLELAGESAIVPLVNSIGNDGPEAAWRATAVLQQIAVSSDAITFGRITATLRQQNKQPDNKLAFLIGDLNAKRAAQRRNMAFEKIRSFGGRFSGEEPARLEAVVNRSDVSLPEPPPDFRQQGGDSKEPSVEAPVLIADAYVSPLLSKNVINVPHGESLTIDQSWRGGDEGLSQLCDVPELSALNLSRAPLTDAALDTIAKLPAIQSLEIEDMPFSAAALARFRTRQPRARVVTRGAKLLEVNAER